MIRFALGDGAYEGFLLETREDKIEFLTLLATSGKEVANENMDIYTNFVRAVKDDTKSKLSYEGILEILRESCECNEAAFEAIKSNVIHEIIDALRKDLEQDTSPEHRRR